MAYKQGLKKASVEEWYDKRQRKSCQKAKGKAAGQNKNSNHSS